MLCFKKCWWIGIVLVACLCFAASSAQAAVAWNEGVNGDISGDRMNPSSAALVLGSNTVTATSVGGAGIDREYITLSVPAGRNLGLVLMQAYAGVDGTAFIGVQSGSTFTEPPTGANPANILGYTHFGTAVQSVGENILNDIAQGPGSMGFSPPYLPAGNYTFWIQQTSSSSPSTYTLDFVVTPEPGALVLCGTGIAMLLAAQRRRAKR
jgi:hypothetical protein